MKTVAESNFISSLLRSTALTIAAGAFFISLPAQAQDIPSTPDVSVDIPQLPSEPTLPPVDTLELPSGGDVVAGGASFDYSAPGQLDVNQSTDRAVIDWDSFNIGEDATTTFNQPNSNSLAVNRVVGDENPTQILGTLRANGRVMVLDENGVIFGRKSRVDVNGIVASTGKVDKDEVMSGSNKIGLSNFGNGVVENRGQISVADGGLAALVAPTVRNSGVINAKLGKVALASGDRVTVDFYGDNLIEVALGSKASKAIIDNSGAINAAGGVVQMTARAAKGVVDSVINMDGVVNASSVSQQGGRIVLSGDNVNITGKMNASGTTGGTVTVDATQKTTLAPGSEIKANSLADQAAGLITVKADEGLTVGGSLEALGAARTGFIDTSAPTVEFNEAASIKTTGEWLLDPTNINIGVIAAALLETQLFFGNATVQTPNGGGQDGNITVQTGIDWDTANTLTMIAHNNIVIDDGPLGDFASIDAHGAGSMILNAGNTVQLKNGAGLRTEGGNITVNSQRLKIDAAGGEINARGGNIDINNTGGLIATAESIRTSGTGTIELNQNKDSGAFSGVEIQNAIDSIQNTGTGTNTVNVGAGTWAEDVEANVDNLVLNGNNKGVAGVDHVLPETLITPSSPGIHVTADNVVVDGLAVDGATLAGIWVDGGDNSTIKNNVITNTDGDGILVQGVANAGVDQRTLVQSNKVTDTTSPAVNSGSGVQVLSSSHVDVDDNTTDRTGWDGVRVRLGSDVTVTDNTLSNAVRTGVYGGSVSNLLVQGNTINHMGRTGVYDDVSSDVTIRDNTIDDTGLNGIRAYYAGGTTVIDDNKVSNTGENGISVENSGNVHVTANKVSNTDLNGIDFVNVDNSEIVGNKVRYTTGEGISLANGSNNDDVKFNIVHDTGKNGIHVDASSGTFVGFNLIGYKNWWQSAGAENINGDGILISNVVNSGDYTTVRGNKVVDTKSPTQNSGSGVQVLKSSNVGVFDNFTKRTGWDGVRVDQSHGIDVGFNTLLDAHRTGVYVGQSGNVDVFGNLIDDVGLYGVHTDWSSDINIGYNKINDTGLDGVLVDHNYETSVHNNKVTNTGANGITALYTDSLKINENKIGSLFGTIGGDGIHVDHSTNGAGTTTEINDNHIFNVDGDGIDVANSAHVTIDPNVIVGTDGHGISLANDTDVKVLDNKVSYTDGNGINADNVTNSVIWGNRVHDTDGYGIALWNGSNNDWVKFNTVYNTGASGILVDASNNSLIGFNLIGYKNWWQSAGAENINGDGILVRNVVNSGGYTSVFDNKVIDTKSPTQNSGSGVQVRNSNNVGVFGNFTKRTGWDGVRVDQSHGIDVGFNTLLDAGRTGVYVGQSGNVDVFGNFINDVALYGIHSDWSGDIDIGYNKINEAGLDGVLVDHNYDTSIHDNKVTNTGANGINALYTSKLSINENKIGSLFGTIGGDGIHVDHSTNGSGTTTEINDNHIFNVNGDGIEVLNSAHVTIDPNVIVGTDGHGINLANSDDVDVLDNFISYTGGNGINADNTTDALIKGNKVHDTDGFGIALVNGSDDGWIKFNTVYNTGESGILVDASDATKVLYNKVGYKNWWQSAGAGNINGDGILIRNVLNTGDEESNTRTLVKGNKVIDTFSPEFDSGSGVQVLDSYHVDVDGNEVKQSAWDGVRVEGGGDITVTDNVLKNLTRTGVYAGLVDGLLVDGNSIRNAERTGIYSDRNFGGVTVTDNKIKGVNFNGILIAGNHDGHVTVNGNRIKNTGLNGIEAQDTSDLEINENKIGSWWGSIGQNGILVNNSTNGDGTTTEINDNTITNVSWDGIKVTNSNYVTIDPNVITDVGGNGISVYGGSNVDTLDNEIDGVGLDGVHYENVAGVNNILGNIISNTGLSGVYITGNDYTNIGNNIITNPGVDDDNEDGNDEGGEILRVSEFEGGGAPGIYVAGPHYGYVNVFGNTVTNYDIGMKFESGLIDLTGATNTVNNGSIGLQFAPVWIEGEGEEEPVYEQYAKILPLFEGGSWSSVDLVGDTIGTTAFNGQSTYYVELLNTALFNPGTPTLENGMDATYEGKTAAEMGIPALEDMFQHYNDDPTVGLFFFANAAPGFEQSRVFREDINPFTPNGGAAGFTITGLPYIPGSTPPGAPNLSDPGALNLLAPAAGPGSKPGTASEPTTEELAAIAPAAGPGENTACWGDAVTKLTQGQAASYSFSTSPSSALSDAASCGTPGSQL